MHSPKLAPQLYPQFWGWIPNCNGLHSWHIHATHTTRTGPNLCHNTCTSMLHVMCTLEPFSKPRFSKEGILKTLQDEIKDWNCKCVLNVSKTWKGKNQTPCLALVRARASSNRITHLAWVVRKHRAKGSRGGMNFYPLRRDGSTRALFRILHRH